jgi:hypothetical protein
LAAKSEEKTRKQMSFMVIYFLLKGRALPENLQIAERLIHRALKVDEKKNRRIEE